MRADEPVGPGDRSEEGRGRVALVTGASSGIGQAFARLLAAKGYDVIPLARRRERLEALKAELEARWNVRVTPHVADLADPDAVRSLADELAERAVSVDLLVNNAGFRRPARYADIPWDVQERTVRVMGLAVLELTHRVLPGMVERGWGRVISVSSIVGTWPCSPRDILYCAAKTMVIRFSEGLSIDYAGTGVHATVCLPGTTDTEIFQAAGLADQVSSKPSRLRAGKMPPERVAREAYVAVMAGRPVVIPGRVNRAAAVVMLHTPLSLSRRMANFMSG